MSGVSCSIAVNTYQLHGLSIRSDFPLPALVPAAPGWDGARGVTIRRGTVDESLSDCRVRGIVYEISGCQYRLDLPGIARYLVSEGTEIVVDAVEDATESSVRLFLLGAVWGGLLHPSFHRQEHVCLSTESEDQPKEMRNQHEQH